MTIEQIIHDVRKHLFDAGLDQLAEWDKHLSTEYAWIATQIAQIKRDRALKEIEIKQRLLTEGGKFTEKEVERQYFATSEGQHLAYAQEMQKAVSKLISAVRYQRDVLNKY